MTVTFEPKASTVFDEGKTATNSGAIGWLAAGWMLCQSLWVLLGLVQLPAAASLIELEGLKRARPITADDHFSSLPELERAFDTANLAPQHLFLWIIVMGTFAVTGLAIAVNVVRKIERRPRQVLAVMAATWCVGVIVAVANLETLDLVMWLNN